MDGPFCYPAPKLEIDDYDRIRAKAADFCLRLGADKLDRFAPKPYVRSGAAKWEAQPFEYATVDACIAGLSDADLEVRRAAAASLAGRGEAALPASESLKQLLTRSGGAPGGSARLACNRPASQRRRWCNRRLAGR